MKKSKKTILMLCTAFIAVLSLCFSFFNSNNTLQAKAAPVVQPTYTIVAGTYFLNTYFVPPLIDKYLQFDYDLTLYKRDNSVYTHSGNYNIHFNFSSSTPYISCQTDISSFDHVFSFSDFQTSNNPFRYVCYLNMSSTDYCGMAITIHNDLTLSPTDYNIFNIFFVSSYFINQNTFILNDYSFFNRLSFLNSYINSSFSLITSDKYSYSINFNIGSTNYNIETENSFELTTFNGHLCYLLRCDSYADDYYIYFDLVSNKVYLLDNDTSLTSEIVISSSNPLRFLFPDSLFSFYARYNSNDDYFNPMFCCLFFFGNSNYVELAGYTQGYTNGYNNGYTQGFNEGSSLSSQDSYTNGYNIGYAQGNFDAENYTFFSLFGSVLDAPVTVLMSILNFQLLGVNLWALFTGLLTLAVLIFVIKLFIGGK